MSAPSSAALPVAASSASAASSEVLQVLEAYLADLERGVPPHPDELLARHPDLAEPLKAYLASLEFLHRAALSLHSPAGPEPRSGEPSEASGQLGDFRILREIGRGGMGVVYEAEQMSLGRRVALKVLPFAGALDARQLQRFKNEAQAAAQLHHTNIVPVHYVGSERGVHFYAMQFIEGQTLTSVIKELRRQAQPSSSPLSRGEREEGGEGVAAEDRERKIDDRQTVTQDYQSVGAPAKSTVEARGSANDTPATDARSSILDLRSSAHFRTVAQLGIQAAEALEHAHQTGIIHRDIKPGNLMVEYCSLPTAHCPLRLWITDFGLAHCQNQAGVTMTGDLVGTLRYMSPEQALAKRVPVDHRTDIYSLGATLYELLTLEPAYAGNDRQELLRQIAFEEPRRLRRINKSIPAELETIVLKAMEKNPDDRYATGQELADDLRRFLMHEPIRARRPNLIQRGKKWCLRHRPWVAAATLFFTIVVLMAGAWTWTYEHDLAVRRSATERGVSAALVEAETLSKQGWKELDDPDRWQATIGLAQSAVSRAEQLSVAGAPTAELIERIHEVRLNVDEASRASRLRADLERIRLEQTGTTFDYAAAAPLYAEALRQFGMDITAPGEALELIRGSPVRMYLQAALEDWAYVTRDRAEWQQLQEILRLTETDDPFRSQWRAALKKPDAKALAQLATDPEFLLLPAVTLVRMARDLRRVNEPEAAEHVLRAAQQRYPNDYWLNEELALQLTNGKPTKRQDAVRFATAALALRPGASAPHNILGVALKNKGDVDGAILSFRAALRIDPEDPKALNNLGDALHAKGELEEAITCLRKAITVNSKYALPRSNLGSILLERGDVAGAIREFQEAIAIDPKFGQAYCNLGTALIKNGDAESGTELFRKAIAVDPQNPHAHYNLGNRMRDTGDVEAAEQCFRRAIALNPYYAEAYCNLGQMLTGKGHYAEALAAYQRGHQLGSARSRWSYPSGQWLREAKQQAELADRLPSILKGETKLTKVEERLACAAMCQLHKNLHLAAVRFYRDAFQSDPKCAEALNSNRYNAACAAALAGCGQAADATQLADQERADLRKQALEWLKADLAGWQKESQKNPEKSRAGLLQTMRHWQQDNDLAGVRGEALAKLPAAERAQWENLWADVEKIIRNAETQGKNVEKPNP